MRIGSGFCGKCPFIVFLFLLVTCFLPACDDSLVAILLKENPEERFLGPIGRMTASVKTMGELINRGDYQKSRELLVELMQVWLEFDNGWLLRPPFEIDDPEAWRRKSAAIAERIGAIRRKIGDGRFADVHPDLDFLVTELTDLLARKVGQKPLLQVLIGLDGLAAGLNPAIADGAAIASAAEKFSQALEGWKSLDPSPAFQAGLSALRDDVGRLRNVPPGDVVRRAGYCRRVRSAYEDLKRRFVLAAGGTVP